MSEKLSVRLSVDELQELLELVENQVFRMRFIDPKMPGYRANPEKLELAKSAVQVLQEAFKKAKGFIPPEQGQNILKRSAT